MQTYVWYDVVSSGEWMGPGGLRMRNFFLPVSVLVWKYDPS